MNQKRRLIAGVTVSGAVLCLTLSASGRTLDQQVDEAAARGPQPLPSQVEQLRARLVSGVPSLNTGADRKSTLQNIVQFFNFFNCSRPGWKNC